MNEKKIRLEINLPHEDYEQIKKYVDNYNENIIISKNLCDYGTVENFVIGSIKNEINTIKNMNEVFCELKTRGYIRPIKLKNNFKEILKNMNLKQLELEEMTGIGSSDISNYMNNRKLFSFDHFMRIWISLGCPDITEIFYVDGNKK